MGNWHSMCGSPPIVVVCSTNGRNDWKLMGLSACRFFVFVAEINSVIVSMMIELAVDFRLVISSYGKKGLVSFSMFFSRCEVALGLIEDCATPVELLR